MNGENDRLADRFLGSVFGAALGDALAAGVWEQPQHTPAATTHQAPIRRPRKVESSNQAIRRMEFTEDFEHLEVVHVAESHKDLP